MRSVHIWTISQPGTDIGQHHQEVDQVMLDLESGETIHSVQHSCAMTQDREYGQYVAVFSTLIVIAEA